MHWPSVPPRNCSSRVRSIYQSFDIRTHFRLSTLTLWLVSFTLPLAVGRTPALPVFRGEPLPRSQEASTMPDLPGYRRPYPGTQPNYLHPPYVSSIKRAPSTPLVYLPHTLSEVTGPLFDSSVLDRKACDLTRQHHGEPLGERIIASGRVLDENGRPVPGTLIELWQANAAGRYLHKVDQHDAPLDPNFTGCGHTLTDS